MARSILETNAANDSPARRGGPVFLTIQQKSTGRFLDAHLTDAEDFRVVTREKQGNDTQRWQLRMLGDVYVINQASNGQYLIPSTSADDILVTWPLPPPPIPPGILDELIPRWAALRMDDGTYRLRDARAPLYIDAYVVSEYNYQVVRRPFQNSTDQRWLIDSSSITSPGGVTVRQRSTERFLDAYQDASSHSYRVVTRPEQNNDTQRWVFTHKAFICTLRQAANDRFLDAHQSADSHSVVTRPEQNNDTQRWVFSPRDDGESYAISQLSSTLSIYAQTAGGFQAHTTNILPPWSPFPDGEWLVAPA